ncbi:MAG: hypothetical protein H0V46_06705 [Sphingomonas sp.]|nr:hypothetical protein [Sphingomonas sp.]
MLMMFSLALLSMFGGLASVYATPSGARTALVKPEVAAARVAGCGFKSVRARFDDTLQEDVVEILDVSFSSEKQLRCVAEASLQSHYYVTFPAPVEQTYQSLYWRMSRDRDKANARAWLEKRGLLGRLPAYDPKRSDEITFVRTLESLCGPKAAGTLKPMGGMAAFADGALGTLGKGTLSAGKLGDETLWCLMNAVSASGYALGFIGNEAYQPER